MPTPGAGRISSKALDLFAYALRLVQKRKSSIYRGQPPFAMFGIGPYSFAPWKVAIGALQQEAAVPCSGAKRGEAGDAR